MTEFHHGITAREAAIGKIPLRNADTNTIAMLAFADDADENAFPLNTPVLVTSISRALPKAGASGNLRKNLEIISQITSPTLVVIRIENPFSDGEFDQSQVIGTTEEHGQRTGLQALLTVKSVLGITPKIICVSDAETIDVANALGAICKKLRAYAYITPRNENGAMLPTAEAVAHFRKMLAFREIELIWPEWASGNVFLGISESENDSCTIEPIAVSIKNLIEFDEGKKYALFYSIDGMPRLHQLDAEIITLQEGSYLNVAEMLNNFYGIDRNIFKIQCEVPDFHISCKLYKQTYPIYLRKASGYWSTLSAAQISVVYKNVTHTVDTSAGNFSSTGDLYNYIIALFDSLKTFLQGIGLDGFLIPDETFKNGTGTSFNAGYFPQFRIEAPDGDLSQFSINWYGTNGWLLDGYKQSNECMTHYSLDEVFNANTLLKFSTYHPANNEEGESEEEGNIELEPHKSKIFFDTLTIEKNGFYNILSALGIHKDITLNGCYIKLYSDL